jgi:peptidoglycan/LPS O-acetylase OafA/YrhL
VSGASITTEREFRPDVQGLRAVAVGAVLLAHAGVPFAAGGYVGVDVFFVISGYLITRLLAAELEATGSISLARFYARRVKRLLPLAFTVLAVVVVLAGLLLPPLRADEAGRDVAAAGVYAVNWRFAAESVDYFAAGAAQSPIEHFWSLAVEEQFYLAWPALLLAATWWWRRRGGEWRPALWVLLGSACAGSFAYAVHAVAAQPSAAYFSTPARVWELALGGLLALALAARRPGPRAAAGLAWAGAAAFAAAVLVLEPGAAFPAWPALMPTLGAAALIAAGAGAGRAPAPVRGLARPPMQRVGDLSYAWYLWHWPALVFAAAALGPLSVAEGLLVTAASFVPTVLSHRWIEQPLRRSRVHVRAPRLAIAAAPATAAATVALGLGLTVVLSSPPTLAEADAEGAVKLERTQALQRAAGALRPAPRDADEDRGRVYDDGCLAEPRETRSKRCAYGDPRGRRTVVLFGDSHAMQYFPPLERIARRRGWRLVHLAKAGCPPQQVTVRNAVLGRRYDECREWREHALRRIERGRPDLVVVSGSLHYNVLEGDRRLGDRASRLALRAGYVPTLRRIDAASRRLVVIRDQPRPPRDIPSCVAEALDDLGRCAFDRGRARGRPQVERPAVARVPGAELLDATSRYCPTRTCPAVIGDVLVYRNSGHLTATYARTMARWLARRLPYSPGSRRGG